MDYKIVKLKEIADFNKESIGKNSNYEFINYLDTANITNGAIDTIVRMSVEEAPSRAKRIVHNNDIVYSTVRPNLCHYGILDSPVENMIVSTGFTVISCKDDVNPYYVYNYLTQNDITSQLHSIAENSTSAYPSIKPSDLENIEIKLPKLDIQNKIAKILTDIDKKIKINNEINNNLFELLKQEFREKFYNKKGKDSYLRDYISETIGGDWGKSSPGGNNNTMVYCVRGADIPSMEYGNKGNAPIRYILEKNYKNKKLDPNNIIIEISGGGPTQSTGRTAFITKSILDMYDSPLLCTNFCRAIEAKSDILAPFVYLNLKLMYDDDIFFNWENGTTGIKNLALNDLLNNLKVKTPDEMMLKNFYLLFNNIMNKISNNSNENIKLEQLRDTLLPKLINGEIDLDNIEI